MWWSVKLVNGSTSRTLGMWQSRHPVLKFFRQFEASTGSSRIVGSGGGRVATGLWQARQRRS
jgi:hypothetical protein